METFKIGFIADSGLGEAKYKNATIYNANRDMLQDFPKHNKFNAPNLGGSIRVIFVTLPIGAVAALASFFLEVLRNGELLKRLLNGCVTKFKFLTYKFNWIRTHLVRVLKS